MEITSTKPVSLTEVKNILEKREKENSEGKLEYEQNLALEHAKKFSKYEKAEANKRITELTKKKIPQETAIKIVEIKPTQPETLKAIMLRDKVELSEDEINEIFKLL